MPKELTPVEDPIHSDVSVETAYSVRDLLTTLTARFAQVNYRVKCNTGPKHYDICKLKRCLIVSFAVAYITAKERARWILSLKISTLRFRRTFYSVTLMAHYALI